MKIADIDFPDPLLNALRRRELVVFAGAGVSMGEPANLPGFSCLAKKIAKGTGQTMQEREQVDHFLGRIERKQGVKIRDQAKEILTNGNPQPNELHKHLLRLYPASHNIRIVTTNFDQLFEEAARTIFKDQPEPEVFQSLAHLDNQSFSEGDLYGIVHAHGSIKNPAKMILTLSDFGRAYLTGGWASRFMVDLFRYYPVLFIGYGHNDTMMNYLTEALSNRETKGRFALIPEDDDSERWEALGITPITYPSPPNDDHRALYEGVRGLAEFVDRDIVAWHGMIADIAKKSPATIAAKEAETLRYALGNVEQAAWAFRPHAKDAAWLGLLDEWKYLDTLFGDGEWSDRDTEVTYWIAEHCVIERPDDLLLLIGGHDMNLHINLWRAIAEKIGQEDRLLDNSALSRWVSVLIATLPPLTKPGITNALLWLGKRCVDQGEMASLVQIFDVMSALRSSVRKGSFLPGVDLSLFSTNWGDTSPEIEVALAGGGYRFSHLNDLWQKCLKPELETIAEPLLIQVVRRFEERHAILVAWQQEQPTEYQDSYRRSAIEPHEQNVASGTIDLLIDIARDCLEWLASNGDVRVAYWCDRLFHSEIVLLRRLAVHTLSRRSDRTADQKIEWLLEQVGLYDFPLHHEIFQAVKSIYPEAGEKHRGRIIGAILAFRWPEGDENRDEKTAYIHFNWLSWLHGAAPDDELIHRPLDDLRTRYPKFKVLEYPDLTHYHGEAAWVPPPGNRQVEEILKQPAAKWPVALLKGPEPVSAMIERAPERGFEIADVLVQHEAWESELWSCLIHQWSKMELDEERYREVLRLLDNAKLYKNHADPIAWMLLTLVQGDGRPVLEVLPQANDIAMKLWDHLDNYPDRINDIAMKLGITPEPTGALNHPAGNLALFWLFGCALSPSSEGNSEDYGKIFSKIVEDEDRRGRLGKKMLAGRLDLLLEFDEQWTRERLLPLFEPDKSGKKNNSFRFVWLGFLSGRLYRKAVELLKEAFLSAVEPIGDTHPDLIDIFVDRYTTLLSFYVDDPIERWIPTLFAKGSLKMRLVFTEIISRGLPKLDGAGRSDLWERWLEEYWKNRLAGVPVALNHKEMGYMLGWLPHLDAVFPKAVPYAVKMIDDLLKGQPSPEPLDIYILVSELAEGALPETYPEELATLLVSLGRLNLRISDGWYKLPAILDKLLQADLSENSKKALKEMCARLRIPWPSPGA